MNKILGFQGEYRFLSNFAECPGFHVYLDEVSYPSVEYAYQAAKTLDLAEKESIRKALTPVCAKRLGRKVTIRPDWDLVKLKIMEDLLRQKFSHYVFKHLLKQTKYLELVETNLWHDNFYGDCVCSKCKNILGENNLGKLLMKIRD